MPNNSTKTKIASLFEHSFINLKIIIFVLSLVSVLTYLLVVNYLNTLGIEMGQMKFRISKLQDQNRDLENLATQLKSMQRIEEVSSNQLLMVSAENYQYLSEAAAVAVKK